MSARQASKWLDREQGGEAGAPPPSAGGDMAAGSAPAVVAAAVGGAPPPGFPLPASFPPGVDPATYKIAEVTRLLRRAAYFSLFSVHDPAIPNIPIPAPGNPQSLAGIKVNETTHRFDIRVEVASCDAGLRAANVVGQTAAHVHIDWLVIPDDFAAAPDRVPPLTALDPTRSQRFTMMNGSFQFVDKDGSGMKGFGAGRTFPAVVGGQPRLNIGANIDMLEGLGRLAGLQGCAVVNGYIQPPQNLFINIMMRVMDPSDRLQALSRLTPLQPEPDPDPTSVFMTLLGEPDPERPTTLDRAPDGTLAGSSVHELLRLVHVAFDLGKADLGLRSRTKLGEVVGRLSTKLLFNPLDPATPGTAETPIPFQTRNGELTFWGSGGEEIGSLRANLVEGRAFTTPLAGAPMPVFRMIGFGPFLEGTKQFAGASGMLTLSGVVSVFPRTLSNMYILRFLDVDGRFRAAVRRLGAPG
jgi:hypothetical protein